MQDYLCSLEAAANRGVNGQTLNAMMLNAASVVDPLYNGASTGKQVAFCWGGTNDIQLGGAPASNLYNDIKLWGNARKAAGWDLVIIVTVLPRGSSPTFETTRQTYRSLVLADFTTPTANPNVWTGGVYADYVIDIGNDPTIGIAGSQTNLTYYNPDQIHLVTPGNTIFTNYLRFVFGLALP